MTAVLSIGIAAAGGSDLAARIAPVAEVNIDKTGHIHSVRLHSVKQDHPGGPRMDPEYGAARLIAATLLAFLPIYLANIAFAKRFQQSSDSQSAFAINLLGALVGGCLEYAALVTGYNNLLLLTGLLYLAAFLLIPKAAARTA